VKHPSRLLLPLSLLAIPALVGCHRRSAPSTETSPIPHTETIPNTATASTAPATVPSSSWTRLPDESHDRSVERSYRSPSGLLRVGVIDVKLPFNVPPNLIINGYANDIRKEEGGATQAITSSSPTRSAFTVTGKKLTHDVILTQHNTQAHFLYIRTPAGATVPADELARARQMRDQLESQIAD
jgi:hypothetical protein